jgi:aspartyl-tRNA synthetase
MGLVYLLLSSPEANEDLRAQHRYLDLRRADLAENLKIRSKVAHTIRNYLHDQGGWLEHCYNLSACWTRCGTSDSLS